jgi:hypothetical protein
MSRLGALLLAVLVAGYSGGCRPGRTRPTGRDVRPGEDAVQRKEGPLTRQDFEGSLRGATPYTLQERTGLRSSGKKWTRPPGNGTCSSTGITSC